MGVHRCYALIRGFPVAPKVRAYVIGKPAVIVAIDPIRGGAEQWYAQWVVE
jgi:hypothetical protein